ncbi:hypothetical protein Tco_0333302 [Tanacetum coccineum]
MLMDSSSDKIDKNFDNESFVLKHNVNIVTWIYLFNGMLLCFIMNLYVPFGIPFDPKRYYKDGDCAMMLRRPSLLYHELMGLEYTDVDIADFEKMLERIYGREIHRVQDVGFQGMPELMRDGLFGMMRMEHHDDVVLDLDAPGTIQFQLGGARRRLKNLRDWSGEKEVSLFLLLGLHTEEGRWSHPSFARKWSSESDEDDRTL